MTLTTMYPGKINSPELTLAEDINSVVTTITVSGDISKLPAAPNLFVIGTGEDAETILYPTDADAGVFSGVTREFQGTAKTWTSGTSVARLFTAYDYDTLRTNVEAMYLQTASTYLYPIGCMIPLTNPATVDQAETSNGVNYVYGEFSQTGTQKLQWLFNLPSGWYTTSQYTYVTFRWTAISTNSGDVKWSLSGRGYANSGTVDQSFSAICDATDTFISTGKVHAITSSGFYGNPTIPGTGPTLIVQLERDNTVASNLDDTIRILSMEIKHVHAQNY